MAARVRAGFRSQAKALRRLAVVFAVELRLKIVTELYLREMSAKEFYEEFGGGSVSRVSQNFEWLERHDWLRHTRTEGPGGSRRGGVERFYRATELAFFDQETWAVLPYSVRVAFSWNIFGQIAARLREALDAGAFDASADSGFTVDTRQFDQLGWERVIAEIARAFESLYEEQEDARLRACRTGEELIRANIVQFAYESPLAGSCQRVGSDRFVEAQEPITPLLVRAARIFGDELCLRIVEAANEQAISAKQFYREFGGDWGKVTRRFRKAADNGWLEEVCKKTGGRRRGATERFYRATVPTLEGKANELLAGASSSLASTKNWKTFRQLHADFLRAMKMGTVDARDDRFLAWSMLELDQVGWKKVTAALRDLQAWIDKEQKLAASRLAKSGEKPIAITIALASFQFYSEGDRQH